MAYQWQGMPVSAGDNIASYGWSPDQTHRWLLQFWRALRERSDAIDRSMTNFPQTTFAYYGPGTVTAATETTITDSGAGWPHEWDGYDDPLDIMPSDYDIYIEVDRDDPRKIVKAQITDTDMTGKVLTVTNMRDFVTSNSIPNISSLVGKRYFILRRDGTFWHDRWPEPPNAQEIARGSYSSTTTSSITDDDALWSYPEDGLIGDDLLVRANDGFLKRVTITGNQEHTIEFATQTWTPSGGEYTVVVAGGFGFPGRRSASSFAWYRTYTSAYQNQKQWRSHQPGDGLHVMPLPAITLSLLTGDECLDEEIVDIFDRDVLIPYDDECNDPPDTLVNIALTRTLRYIQMWLDSNCIHFIEPGRSYHGAKYIPFLTTASFHRLADINDGKTFKRAITSTGGGTYHYSSLGVSPIPPVVYYSVHKPIEGTEPLGDAVEAGLAVATDTELSGASGDYTGYDIIISFGWPRTNSLEFRYLYPREVFLPDLDSDTLGNLFPVDPPTSDFPGSWYDRPVSTNYTKRRDHTSHMAQQTSYPGSVEDTGPVFFTGDAARYIGDNYSDPTFGEFGPYDASDDPPPNLLYEDFLYTGHGPLQHIGGDSGTVTTGTSTQLTDSTKNWWYTGFSSAEHTGTGTTGSSITQLTDSTKSTDGFWTLAGRLKRLIIEVEVSTGVWEKRPIDTHPSGTTVTWALPLSVSALGRPYRIREAQNVRNRWAGRQLVLTNPDDTTVTTVIRYSDDKTLFFDFIGSFAISEETTYEIIEHKPGRVLIRNSTHPIGWELPDPESADSQGGENWLEPPTHPVVKDVNEPHSKHEYGRINVGDHINETLINAIYRGINVLRWTISDYTWTANGENNTIGGGFTYTPGVVTYPDSEGGVFGSFGDAWAYAVNDVNTNWWPVTEVSSNAAPGAEQSQSVVAGLPPTSPDNLQGSIRQVSAATIYAYPQLNVFPSHMACSITFCAVGWIDNTNPDQGISDDWSTPPDTGRHEYKFTPTGISLLFRLWSEVDSLGASTANNRMGSRLGPTATTPPAWDQPSDPQPMQAANPYSSGWSASIDSGFYIGGTKAILKWDVTGGMRYID